MNTVGASWTNILDALRLYDDATLTRIKRVFQQQYYLICAGYDWSVLRRHADYTFSTSDSAGKIMPADMIGIIGVFDSDGDPYIAGDQMGVKQSEFRSWSYVEGATTPIYAGKKITVENGATTFTTDQVIAASSIGEYMKFSEEPGFYKLATISTFTPAYRGPRIQDKEFVVRPATTRYAVIYDTDGDVDAETVTVYYWVYPEPLYEGWQTPMIDPNILESATLEKMYRYFEPNDKRADQAKADFLSSLAVAQHRDPKFITPKQPQGKMSYPIRLGWR